MDSLDTKPNLLSVGLFRRLGAILYDSFLLISVLFFATGLFQIGWPVDSITMPWFRIYLLIISYLYFSSSWLWGGQTLGMMAWRIRLQSTTDTKITWWSTLRRFIIAIISWSIIGLGFWWALGDKQKRTWHDLASETRLVVIPKNSEQR